jgi:hypothetical protein
MMSMIPFVDIHRSRACGLWLIVPPFTFGYVEPGELHHWHFLLAATVVLIAALELWQDWASVIASRNRLRSKSPGDKSPSSPEILFGPLF